MAGVSGSGALATNGDLKNKTTRVSRLGAQATNGDLKTKPRGYSAFTKATAGQAGQKQ